MPVGNIRMVNNGLQYRCSAVRTLNQDLYLKLLLVFSVASQCLTFLYQLILKVSPYNQLLKRMTVSLGSPVTAQVNVVCAM